MRGFALRFIIAAIMAMSAVVPVLAQQSYRYIIDAAGSDVSARVSFFALASKTAQFPQLSGGIVLSPEHPDSINLDVTLNARALQAGDSVTLARLKGPSFFDVDHYPTVRFTGQNMIMTGPLTADVPGDLTARGITHPALLKVVFARDPAQATGRVAVHLTGRTTINRRDYGMTAWSLIVGNTVTITIKATMVPA